jgi:hypothetical protein
MGNKVFLSQEKPPIYEACAKQFGVNWNNGIIFTYGDVVHCKIKVSPRKLVHEKVHVEQQLSYGVEEWWERYLKDATFRLEQELEAYRAEIAWIKPNVHNLAEKRRMLSEIVTSLSSYIYGNLLTSQQAKELLGL